MGVNITLDDFSLKQTLQLNERYGSPVRTRADMERFAGQYARAKTCVFIYSMGLTQHRFGVDNVKALVNLALARGMLGREKCGIMPIRGHSGVQGGGECGVDPDKLPGGFEVANAGDRARFESLWGAPLPTHQGHRTLQMLEAAHAGELVVHGPSGEVVRRVPIMAGPPPTAAWDGKGADGAPVPPGAYTLDVEATGADGAAVDVRPQVRARVDAVELGVDGPRLRLGNIQITPAAVRSILGPQGDAS